MVPNINMHTMNHGIPQWPNTSARASLDFSNSGDSSLSEIVSYYKQLQKKYVSAMELYDCHGKGNE